MAAAEGTEARDLAPPAAPFVSTTLVLVFELAPIATAELNGNIICLFAESGAACGEWREWWGLPAASASSHPPRSCALSERRETGANEAERRIRCDVSVYVCTTDTDVTVASRWGTIKSAQDYSRRQETIVVVGRLVID